MLHTGGGWGETPHMIVKCFGCTTIHKKRYIMHHSFIHSFIHHSWQQWRVFLTSSSPILLTNLSLLGKYPIKPNFEHFIKEIQQYGTTLDKSKNKKTRKTYEAFCYFKLYVILLLAWIVSLDILLWMFICFCTCCELYMLVQTFV